MSTRPRSAEDIEHIESAASLAMSILDRAIASVGPGQTPIAIADRIDADIRGGGAVPVLKGYRTNNSSVPPFSAAACIGVNHRVVNAIPSAAPLVVGDLVSIDLALSLQGVHADVAEPMVVGHDQAEDNLAARLRRAFDAWLAVPFAGRRPTDIRDAAIEACLAEGLFLLPEHLGHGIGLSLHEPPTIPGPTLEVGADQPIPPGSVLAVELAVADGTQSVRVSTEADAWTRCLPLGRIGATRERTVLLTPDRNRILGVSDAAKRDARDRGA